MPDPVTHSSPYFIVLLTAVASYVFDLPLGVVISAAGGAYWAVYRNTLQSANSFTIYLKAVWMILCGMAIASIMVQGATWVSLHFMGLPDLPQRPLAFMLGFAAIDKKFRDKIIDFIRGRIEDAAINPSRPGDTP
jgi:hypothetical protein